MRVRIYMAGKSEAVDGVKLIIHKNAVEGLVVHSRLRGDVGLCVQARPGQVFVLTGGVLSCFQAGHEIVEDGARVVYPPEVTDG